MDAPHDIGIGSVTQYILAVTGGQDVAYSKPSPTGDSFFDSGTKVSVSSNYFWSTGVGARRSLSSYTLDGSTKPIASLGAGAFSTPAITMSGYHQLSFSSVTQFLLSFEFEDSSGSHVLNPSSVQVDIQGTGQESFPANNAWLNNGSAFTISSVEWENANVAPLGQAVYSVSAPLAETLKLRVYDATLQVNDLLGLPVAGASVSVKLANGTIITKSTGGNGRLTIPMIPLGPFAATVTSFGLATRVVGDASTGAVAQVRVVLSYATLGSFLGLVAILAVGGYLFRRRRVKAVGAKIQYPIVLVRNLPLAVSGPMASSLGPEGSQGET
jgi:hypothetical protein